MWRERGISEVLSTRVAAVSQHRRSPSNPRTKKKGIIIVGNEMKKAQRPTSALDNRIYALRSVPANDKGMKTCSHGPVAVPELRQ